MDYVGPVHADDHPLSAPRIGKTGYARVLVDTASSTPELQFIFFELFGFKLVQGLVPLRQLYLERALGKLLPIQEALILEYLSPLRRKRLNI